MPGALGLRARFSLWLCLTFDHDYRTTVEGDTIYWTCARCGNIQRAGFKRVD